MRTALLVGLTLLAAALVVRLSRAPLTVIAANETGPEAVVGIVNSNQRLCQEGETVPAGASALRLGVSVNVGPRVDVTVFSGSSILASGSARAGWTGEVVTIPVRPLPRAVTGASVCIGVGPTLEPVGLVGWPPPRRAGEPPGRVKVEYLRPGPRSWWASAGTVARRMGLGRSPSGTWVAFVPLVLMLAAAALVAWLIPRQLQPQGRARIAGAQETAPPAAAQTGAEHAARPATAGAASGTAGAASGTAGAASGTAGAASGTAAAARRLARHGRRALRRVPTAAWACGAVACLSAASWSIVQAPLQVPDEPSHFAYAQDLAEGAGLPKSGISKYSAEELVALRDLEHTAVRYNTLHGSIATPAQQQRLEHDLARHWPRTGEGAGVAKPQPPLYYSLLAVPYRLASGGNLLERLALMRLVSALLAGLTAVFAYLFLREALPAAPWAWTVGALGVALFPLVGFMSGAVNPDAGLCAVSSALLFCLARAFRHGLSTRRAVAIGAVTAVGFTTKLNFVGLLPGVVLATAVLTWRAWPGRGRAALRPAAVAAAIGASPVCVYALVNLLTGQETLGLTSSAVGLASEHGSLAGELGYIWQLYLPRLPGMAHDFPGLPMTRLWFERTVGLYGWLDTAFPPWVYTAALVPAAAILALCVAGVAAARTELRRRAAEAVVYATFAVGVAGLIGADSYLEFPSRAGSYAEPRYLLPLTVLFGAILALAARGAGRRYGPAVGALLVVLLLGHDVFSQLITIARYYG